MYGSMFCTRDCYVYAARRKIWSGKGKISSIGFGWIHINHCNRNITTTWRDCSMTQLFFFIIYIFMYFFLPLVWLLHRGTVSSDHQFDLSDCIVSFLFSEDFQKFSMELKTFQKGPGTCWLMQIFQWKFTLWRAWFHLISKEALLGSRAGNWPKVTVCVCVLLGMAWAHLGSLHKPLNSSRLYFCPQDLGCMNALRFIIKLVNSQNN